MKTYRKIEELVATRINGNSIKGNTTYENMIKSVKSSDIDGYCINNFGDDGILWVYRKIDKIEFIRNLVEGK